MNLALIRRRLVAWYEANRRDLPWRANRDPYRIWISEIMLQQTRVAAVVPYYERFLTAFPTVEALAKAPEEKVLRMWAGLGYYSRARNLQAAAQEIMKRGAFPQRYEELLTLKGIGTYTAAAIASIAFGQAHAAIDGNVKRVTARLIGMSEVDEGPAGKLLDRRDPGRWNQAMMELGALVCVPRTPLCAACPLNSLCVARRQGKQLEIPARKDRKPIRRVERILVVVKRGRAMLLQPSILPKGFWELPEAGPQIQARARLGQFRHAILDSQYHCEVYEGSLAGRVPAGCRWWSESDLHQIPLSTASKKALQCLELTRDE